MPKKVTCRMSKIYFKKRNHLVSHVGGKAFFHFSVSCGILSSEKN